MTRLFAILAAGMSLSIVGGCAQTIGAAFVEAAQFHIDLQWPTRASQSSVVGEVQSAKAGQFLFKQDVRLISQARIAEGFSVSVPVPIFSPKLPDVAFAAGAVLAPVDGAKDRGDIIYCDPRLTHDGGEYRRMRVCAVDRNTDGKFDEVIWNLWSLSLFQGVWLADQSIKVSLPYTVEPAEPTLTMKVGPVVTLGRSGARLRLAVENSHVNEIVDDQFGQQDTVKHPAGGGVFDARATTFGPEHAPIRLRLEGAEIEILSITRQGDVTYRVLQGFPENGDVRVSYNGALIR